MIEATTVVQMIILAACFAGLYTYYNTRIIGDFIRSLSERGAVGEENAISVRTACANSVKAMIVSLSLKGTTSLHRFVGGVSEDEGEPRFYIIPEAEKAALKRYESKGLRFVVVIICIVIMALFAIISTAVLPHIMPYFTVGDDAYVPDDGPYYEERREESTPEESEGASNDEGGTNSRYDIVS